MLLGKVVGNVVSTIKNEKLIGMKLLVVELVNEKLVGEGKTEVVVDPIGAGFGEVVLLCKGSSARIVFGGDVDNTVKLVYIGCSSDRMRKHFEEPRELL